MAGDGVGAEGVESGREMLLVSQVLNAVDFANDRTDRSSKWKVVIAVVLAINVGNLIEERITKYFVRLRRGIGPNSSLFDGCQGCFEGTNRCQVVSCGSAGRVIEFRLNSREQQHERNRYAVVARECIEHRVARPSIIPRYVVEDLVGKGLLVVPRLPGRSWCIRKRRRCGNAIPVEDSFYKLKQKSPNRVRIEPLVGSDFEELFELSRFSAHLTSIVLQC